MLLLYNGCNCSDLSVYPTNWKTVKAKTNFSWYIQYRFRDPAFRTKYPKGKQVVVAGMNTFKDLAERQAATRALLEDEMKLLKDEGYNPITKSFYIPPDTSTDIEPLTPFIKALNLAYEKLIGVHGTLVDIKSVIAGTEKSAKALNFDRIPISQISRKHIKLILEHRREANPKFSADRYNKYRAYLIKLFKELVELEAAEYVVPRDISKMKVIQKQRLTLTDEERKLVNDHLYRINRPFWKFVQIFFHAGGRETELMLLQGKDVNLITQKYRSIIKKGKHFREVFRTIKDIALPFWTDQMATCGPEDYVFSVGLEPGAKAIRVDQIGRRWRHYVKGPAPVGLGIKADLYSLRHTNTDAVVELLGMADAAKMNGHANTDMVAKVYAINEPERQHQRLKQVQNKFAG